MSLNPPGPIIAAYECWEPMFKHEIIMLDNQVLDEGMEILEKRFKVVKRLGSGSFGEIYKGN